MAKKMSCGGVSTPWGVSQGNAIRIAVGLCGYSTAGHGGIAVSFSQAMRMSEWARQMGVRYGGRWWYEEDAAWAIPIFELYDREPAIGRHYRDRGYRRHQAAGRTDAASVVSRLSDAGGKSMCDEVNTPRCDDRLALLRKGLVCEFMGHRWRLLAGEVIEDALQESWRDGDGLVDGEGAFIDWTLDGERLAGFLPAALGLDSAADEFWDKLRGAVDELLEQHRHELTEQTTGRPDGRPV